MSQKKIAEYKSLLDLYVRAVNVMAGQEFEGEGAWIVEAEYLAKKLFLHLASLLYLRAGTKLEGVGTDKILFYDFASSAVLARSAFETFLAFYFVFVDPTVPEERYLRYCVWKLGGLSDRQRYTSTSEAGRQRLKEEGARIEELRKEIEKNPRYLLLPRPRQRDAFKGEWRFGKSWLDLAMVAGSSERFFVGLYAYLSSYAHSGYLSALQIGQAQKMKEHHDLGEGHIGVGLTLMSHFLRAYGKLFPPVAELIDSNPRDKALLEKWYITGKSMDALYDSA